MGKKQDQGFRPGKVPRNILERYFKDYSKSRGHTETGQETINVLSEKNLQPVSTHDQFRRVESVSRSILATIEVKPDINGGVLVDVEGRRKR